MMGNKKHAHHRHHHDRDDGHPNWVGRKERRLLASTTRIRFKPRLIVAQDNSGQFMTVQEAIDAAKEIGGDVQITAKIPPLKIGIVMLRRVEDINILLTIVFNQPGIDGPGFVAQGITFLNTAGTETGQAVALRSSSDKSVFYQCAFYGYHDTLCAHSQTQFYKECETYGTMDFIFGNAAAIFQNCTIYTRKRPGDHYYLVITGQGRDNPYQNTGIVIQDSLVGPAPDLVPALDAAKTYLGRPWKPYSRTVIRKSDLGGFIDPTGWLEAGEESKLSTLFYAEYDNVGPGSSLDGRVK
ncbi:putative pectinesterase/pectinesterase inhibitor 17 [Drosera capensis]